MRRLLSKASFNGNKVDLATLRTRFLEHGRDAFFPAFRDCNETVAVFREHFKGKQIGDLLERSERIIDGKFDLLGYLNLDFGIGIDWHYEPVARKHLPVKHCGNLMNSTPPKPVTRRSSGN